MHTRLLLHPAGRSAAKFKLPLVPRTQGKKEKVGARLEAGRKQGKNRPQRLDRCLKDRKFN